MCDCPWLDRPKPLLFLEDGAPKGSKYGLKYHGDGAQVALFALLLWLIFVIIAYFYLVTTVSNL